MAPTPSPAPRRRTGTRQWTPHRSLQWTLDAVTAGPAFVRNGRMDILAANPLFRAFYADLYATPGNQRNLARFTFLDPAARRFYPDWDSFADITVAIVRTEAATPTTRTFTTWSGSCPPAATNSAPGGARTTSATTAPAPSTSTITPSAVSPSPSRAWTWPPPPA